jgi:acyl dehydratase
MEPGDSFELATTPDRWLTVRYAGSSGDFNPIHIDEQFAQSVGLPGRILHGLWSMSQVARAHTETFGGPAALAALSVQFRGLGLPEQEIRVTGQVTSVQEDHAITKAQATQGDTRIVRNARGEIRSR